MNRRVLAIAFAAFAVQAAVVAQPQQRPAGAGQVPAPRGTPAATAEGLSALGDDRVLTEIAGRGMLDLLRHAFDRQNVPEDQRVGLLARISLSRLQDGQPIGTGERRELVRDVVANAGQAVAQARDAQLLFEQAQLLMERGVNEETRLLEYFGDNPELRRHLKPVVDGVSRMLARSAELYQADADALANRINNPTDPIVKQWRAADQAARQARDFRVFADYNRVLALDPDDPQRLLLADQLAEVVAPADNEKNPRRAFVQAYLGKVALARGNEKGLSAARGYFEGVLAAPAGEAHERFDAHYFRTVVEIEDRKLDVAREQLARFREWFAQQDMPSHRPLMLVLEYRLEDAAAAYGTSQSQREQAQARATQVLVELVDQYEGYRPVVTEQLLTRVNAGTDLAALPPLLLDALVDRGRVEAALLAQGRTAEATADGPAADRGIVERGIAAAQELLRRAGDGGAGLGAGQGGGLDAAAVARNAFLLGLMLDVLDRDEEAAEAFTSYATRMAALPQQKVTALRRAIAIVEGLKRGGTLDADARVRVDALEDRLLPLLVGPPVNDKTWAFDLANRLHRLGRLDQAATFYRQVPADDTRKIDAGYLLLLVETARLAELEPTSPKRAALQVELPALGEQTLADLTGAMTAAEGPARDAYRERVARVKSILARYALNETDDVGRALALLENIEQDVVDLPAAESILATALPLRFQATATAGQIDRATLDLLALLERSDPQRGLGYISQFRETINRATDRAEARGDAEAVAQLLATRAAVTPRLVAWIEQSSDPEYRRYAYNFRRFDAETQLQAARAATDPADRRQRLRRATEAYTALESAENLGRFRELLTDVPEAQRQAVPYDREVVFSLGNIAFELGDYEEARSRYGRLLADRAMGNATRVAEEDGMLRQTANDEFWELYLKFFQSNQRLGNAPERMAQELKTLYVAHGGEVGGMRWREEYEALRRELIPDFQTAQGAIALPSGTGGAASAPASRPSGGR